VTDVCTYKSEINARKEFEGYEFKSVHSIRESSELYRLAREQLGIRKYEQRVHLAAETKDFSKVVIWL